MKLSSVIGVLVAIVAAVLGVCIVARLVEKHFPRENFDERQKIARGNAYRVSFWLGVVYNLGVLIYLTGLMDGRKPLIEPYLLAVGGFWLVTLCFHGYCLLADAALPLGQKTKGMAIGYLMIGAMQLSMALNQYRRHPVLSLVGRESHTVMMLMLGVFFLSLSVMYTIRTVWQEKE